MVSSSYGVFYLWATVSFTNSNLARKSHCEEREDINAKFYPFINGEGEKVSWKLWKISLSVKHSFYTFFPLEGCVDLQKEGQSGFCMLGSVYIWPFVSLLITGVFSLQTTWIPQKLWGAISALHSTPCHAGQGVGWGLVLLLALPAPAGIS